MNFGIIIIIKSKVIILSRGNLSQSPNYPASTRQENVTWQCTLQTPFPTSRTERRRRMAHWWGAITAA